MGTEIESTVIIAKPVDEVFEFFLNLDQTIPKVDPNIESVEKHPHGPVGVGTTFVFRQRALGKVRESRTRFMGIEQGRRIEFEAWLGPLRPRMSLRFQKAKQGTRVTVRGVPNPVGVFKLFTRAMTRKGQQSWDGRLDRVKTVLESNS